MSNSFYLSFDQSCSWCGAAFKWDIYVIVDIAERPDLLEKILSETLHTIRCPRCNYVVKVDNIPLLVFRPEHEPHLLFSSTQKSSEEDAGPLVRQLKDALGGRWQDRWVKNGLPNVSRKLLPTAISKHQHAATQELTRKPALPGGVEETLKALRKVQEDLEGFVKMPPEAISGDRQVATQESAKKPTLPGGIEEAMKKLQKLQESLKGLEKEPPGAVKKNNQTSAQESANQSKSGEVEGTLKALEEANRKVEETLENLRKEPSGAVNNQQPLTQMLAGKQPGRDEIQERINELRKAQQENLERLQKRLSSAKNRNQEATTQEPASKPSVPNLSSLARVTDELKAFNDNLQAATQQRTSKQTVPAGLEETLQELRRPADVGNMPRRIRLCARAVQQVSREMDPELWSELQLHLANSLQKCPIGDRADNLEQAIEHYEQALEVRTLKAFPQDWAATQNNLGGAYVNRIRGQRAKNLEQAIDHFQQALQVLNRQTNPQLWAATHNNLATAYEERILGNRADNLEQAISHCRQALEVFTRQAFPGNWAMTISNLANVYRVRIRGQRAKNLEQAIEHYQQALAVFTRNTFPQEWAATQSNLATVYAVRIRGERAENFEQAIHHFQQALTIYARSTFPQQWAITINSFANAYVKRIRGKRAENLEQAIHFYQQVLTVFTRQAFPQEWAQTMTNLASVYAERIRGDRAENIEQAIEHYKNALEVRTRQAFPEEWAHAMYNLAITYSDRIRGDPAENLEQAIHHYQQALTVYTRRAFPREWAMNKHNLGDAYYKRTSFMSEDRAQNIEQAIHHYQQALEIRTRQVFPEECRTTARSLGHLAFNEQRWQLAADAYDEALAAHSVLMQASFTRLGKQSELREVQIIPSRLAYTLVQLGDVERAVEVLEQGCAQLLRESLERQRRDLENLPALGFESLHEAYMKATKQYDQLRILEAVETTRSENWLAQLDSAVNDMRAVVAAIRDEAGQNHPQYRYFLKARPFTEIQKKVVESRLVYLAATTLGGLALAVSEKGVIVRLMPALTISALLERLVGPRDDRGGGGYLGAYRRWRIDPIKEEVWAAWFSVLDETTHWLWDVTMEELLVALKESKAVTLIPTGPLALLPLHAAWTEDASKPTGRRYVLDELNITYAPSAHALWQARLAAKRPADRLMVVDNPDGSLIFSEIEVQAALDVFKQARHLSSGEAKLETVKKEMQKAHVLHFSTHGVAGWEEAEQARLLLADGELTLPEIFELHLEQARLAVLSACETGVPGLQLIEEMIGLPAGMLQAGVPGVIGSLWAVNDMSTAILMARFYSLWREEGQTPQEALRQAQIWLRDSTTTEKKKLFKHFVERQTIRTSKETAQAFYRHFGWNDPDARVFASPYYWAAFTYTGI